MVFPHPLKTRTGIGEQINKSGTTLHEGKAVTSVAMREGWMKASCWVYLFVADTFQSIFWSPVELWLTQMCPPHKFDDGGTRDIRNRLQEGRKFDWSVTLIHKKLDYFLRNTADVHMGGGDVEELFSLTLTGFHLLSHNLMMSQV